MTPARPYLLRAVYQWIVDNHCTPYLAVDATVADVSVPQEYVEDGQITLNVSPTAVAQLHMDNDCVSFNARFAGTPRSVMVPMLAVIGIYARENGQGMAFPDEYEMQLADDDGDEPPPPPRPDGGGKPHLKVVK
ncbi:MAG TPA: ClpXP protease specificity-enhancing factor [Pseudomonadales bacterium]